LKEKKMIMKRQKLAFGTMFAVALLTMACASAKTTALGESMSGTNDQFAIERADAVVYGQADGKDLLVDLAWPALGRGPYPVLVMYFGGGFMTGSRVSWYDDLAEAARRGYAAIAADYRLVIQGLDGTAKNVFPAQIEDARTLLRWIRSAAGDYPFDPERVGVFGFSSGGLVALLAGITSPADGFDIGPTAGDKPAEVRAVVNLAGPTNPWLHNRSIMENWLGGSPEAVPERYLKAYPLTYVDKDDPPVLTIVGSLDSMHPNQEQQKDLDSGMKKVGARHTLVIVEGAGHNKLIVDFRREGMVWEFLDGILQPGNY
jgi:acetyl esterase/lipase